MARNVGHDRLIRAASRDTERRSRLPSSIRVVRAPRPQRGKGNGAIGLISAGKRSYTGSLLNRAERPHTDVYLTSGSKTCASRRT